MSMDMIAVLLGIAIGLLASVPLSVVLRAMINWQGSVGRDEKQ